MTTIRLTTIENFHELLEVIKQSVFYVEKYNEQFLKYCVPIIRHRMEDGEECYLEFDYKIYDDRVCLIMGYHTFKDIATDVEYIALNRKMDLKTQKR